MLQLIQSLKSPWPDAIWAALVGDALGVPHEFKPAHEIPPADSLHMRMPAEYSKSFPAIPYGIWSDDGSQLLALLDALVANNGEYREDEFLANMLRWLNEGQYQPGGRVFDCGAQTFAALRARAASQQFTQFTEGHCGNGSLMRVLPVAALSDTFDIPADQAVRVALEQSSLTHPQLIARVTCALYVELCMGELLFSADIRKSVEEAALRLRARGILTLLEEGCLSSVLEYGEKNLPTGSGYVLNTFWSAIWAIEGAQTLSDALRRAISLGNDTDTVACVTGGLAGRIFSQDDLVLEWREQLVLP